MSGSTINIKREMQSRWLQLQNSVTGRGSVLLNPQMQTLEFGPTMSHYYHFNFMAKSHAEQTAVRALFIYWPCSV
jgi:hypothetical protein